jgi:hypothetical protein
MSSILCWLGRQNSGPGFVSRDPLSRDGTNFWVLRASKSIPRLSMPSHTQNLLVSAVRCTSRQCGVQATINLIHRTEFHGTIPFKCGASSIPGGLGECSPHYTGPRAWKVAPALAVGCTIVMKPSEITPLTALVRHSERPPSPIVF